MLAALKKKLPGGINGKLILSILLFIIILHLVLMTYYLENSRVERQAFRRDAVIQKIINAIYLVEATPISSREDAVQAMEDPVLHASFTSKPLWKMQFRTISFWEISHALRHRLDSFSLSIRLDKGQWLNLNATIYSHLLLQQLIFVGIETLVLGAIFFAVWSVVRFTEPLRKFKSSVDRLGVDFHSSPIEIVGPTAVREVGLAINRMQQRIQTLVRDRTQMLAAISHDLRTPITRLKIRTQFIEDEMLSNNLLSDLDEMEKMINEILSFAREDFINEDKRNIDLVSLVDAICSENQDMGFNVQFSSRLHRAPLLGRHVALKRAFNNLISNAVRYASKIEVTVYARLKTLFIRIDDNGPGIPEKDLKHVFEPFYRGEYSRSRNTGGVGLGLAVTRDIIVAHHGEIHLENLALGGLRVLVALRQE